MQKNRIFLKMKRKPAVTNQGVFENETIEYKQLHAQVFARCNGAVKANPTCQPRIVCFIQNAFRRLYYYLDIEACAPHIVVSH